MLLVLLLSGLSRDLNRRWSVPFFLCRQIHLIRQIMRTLADEQGQLMRRLLIAGGSPGVLRGSDYVRLSVECVLLLYLLSMACSHPVIVFSVVASVWLLYFIPCTQFPLISCTLESPLLLAFDSTKVQVA